MALRGQRQATMITNSAVEEARRMKVPAHVLAIFQEYPQLLRLPLEPMHGWRSSPDEGGHTHCVSCGHTIYRGDPVVGCYLTHVSTVFCPQCVADNPELFREWLASPISEQVENLPHKENGLKRQAN